MHVAILLLIACGSRPAPPVAPPANRVDPLTEAITEVAFRKAALELARRTQSAIEAWGPASYEDVPGRYARLRPRDETDVKGAYLMETAGQYYLVIVEPYGSAYHGDEEPTVPVAWSPTVVDSLAYEQTYSNAHVSLSFSIYKGKVVLLSIHEQSRHQDPEHPSSDDDRMNAFTCPQCPVVAIGHEHAFASAVGGPSPTIDGLLVPTPDP